MEQVEILYLGERPYQEVFQMQEGHFNQLLVEKKENGISSSPMKLILCQHKPVYTLGRNGDKKNLLPDAAKSGAEFIKTNRGGDITFHGPGQLVGYPILDLERLQIGIHQFVQRIEETVIRTMAAYGIEGFRFESAPGVWLDINDPSKMRKIAAIGIKSSRWVTMHGFAFNIHPDMTYFDFINPCGFEDRGVTSLEVELHEKPDFNEVKELFVQCFCEMFEVEKVQQMKNN